MKIKLLLSFLLIHTFLIVNAATPPNATIAYNSQICASSGEAVVIFSGTTGGIFSASPSGLSIDATTGSITPNQSLAGTYVVTYTIPPGVDPAFSTTTTVTINDLQFPGFEQIATMCQGSTPPFLPTTSPNGITGTWSPAVIDNQTDGIYVFTPDSQHCAYVQSLTIIISAASFEPEFTFSSSTLCAGNTFALPNMSANGITGTWSPSTVEATGTYTFTPDAGQCATTATATFQVNPAPTAMFSFSNMTICVGTTTAITIIGTPNAVVVYTVNGSSNQSIVLNSSGTATLITPTLSASTMMCLVYVESFGVGICTTPLSSCCVITVVPSVSIPPIADVTVCSQYTLPALPVGNYFTQPNGVGTMLNAGDVITSTQTVYVYAATASTPSCVSEDSFQVTIIPAVSPTIATADNINYIMVDGAEIVQTLQLNAETQAGNYGYQWMESGNDIIGATNPTYTVNTVFGNSHYYSVRVTNLVTSCISESPIFQVFEIPVPAPVGNPNQTFTLGQTLADIVVSGQNIQWYDALNRNTASNPLPLSTVLVAGVTYFATQTINGHESASSFEITIQFLANDTFAFKDLKFSPNPVVDVLYIQSKDRIAKVTVYNITGQKILQQNFDNLDVRLQLNQIKAGDYFIKLESDNKTQVIKVIKQ
jgi:hypothetical protein